MKKPRHRHPDYIKAVTELYSQPEVKTMQDEAINNLAEAIEALSFELYELNCNIVRNDRPSIPRERLSYRQVFGAGLLPDETDDHIDAHYKDKVDKLKV